MSANGHLGMGNPLPAPSRGTRTGGLYVSELQRARLLDATFAVVAEQGYRGMAVRAVAERAGVSSKTFYDLFVDREDCFLAAFDHGVDQLAAHARPAYVVEKDWVVSIRGGLVALLEFLDREPALQMLVFVEALGAGPRVLERRAQVLKDLAKLIDGGRADVKAGGELPPLTAEGIVGATFGVIHARLLEQHPQPLVELLGGLMATIVLPYRGRAAATRELTRQPAKPTTVTPAGKGNTGSRGGSVHRLGVRPLGSTSPVDFRLTVRTQMVLAVVAEHPGLNNQRISELAGISDQGQISRLMMRLADQGLVENTRGESHAKAWRLTPDGQAVIEENPPSDQSSKRGLRLSSAHALTGQTSGNSVPFRLTALKYKVLTAIAQFGVVGVTPSTRQVADLAGITRPSQLATLLTGLRDHGLLRSPGRRAKGGESTWRLTPKGEEIVHASRPTNRGADPSTPQEES